MPGYPLVNTDTVLYEKKDIYADKDINLSVLDGSKLNIWGNVNYNGVPVTTAGISETLIAGDSALFQLYADEPNGVPLRADSGQTWFQWSLGGVNDDMQVVNGVLTNKTASGVAAGYLQYNFGRAVNRIGADLVFGPYTDVTGSFGLIAWATQYTGGTVPDSNCHFSIKPTGWSYGRFAGGVYSELATNTFAVPLAADNTTVHHVEVVLDLLNSIAYIDLPDGSKARVSNPSIATTPGTVVVFETFASNAATGSKTGAINVWADVAGPAQTSPRVGKLTAEKVIPRITELEQQKVWAVEVSPTPAASAIAPLTMGDVHVDLATIVNTGPSGKLFVEVCAFLDMSAIATVYWQITSGASPFQFWKITDVRVQGIVVVSGIIIQPPNTTYTVKLQHRCLTASTATIRLDNANGYQATMKFTAVA